ncbi:hypothetical protein Taro_004365 [Colocasia esculenta]|uniref:Uncharacterized protein n=1 Tax=Colocasia esculenta TaxID=4460 RepID=A0A843TPV9_COLES|nr:hypothetical protein [Colocasia esculenta]
MSTQRAILVKKFKKRSQWCRHRSLICRHILCSQKEVSGVDIGPLCVDISFVPRKPYFWNIVKCVDTSQVCVDTVNDLPLPLPPFTCTSTIPRAPVPIKEENVMGPLKT